MPTDMPFPVILPSETRTREFDAKLLLAGMLAERGHPVTVGSRVDIHNHIHRLPRGLYLAKDVRSSSRLLFRIMDRLGFSIVAWDEEALIFTDPDTYHDRRVDAESLNRIRAFCAWGAHDRKLIETAPGYRDTPVFVTGNLRFDLLAPRCRSFFEPEVAALRERFGDFILINTNFGRLNYFVAQDAVRETADGRLTNMDAGTEEYWRFRIEVFEAFKAIVPVIARAFPERQLVVRPHPGEAHEVWRDASQGLPNVTVVHEGSVHPWLLASRVAIHNGCTTGLEGFLLDRPVVSYQPIRSASFDDLLPNHVSVPAASEGELLATLESIFEGAPPQAPDARALAESHIGSLDGTLAAERLDALIAEHGEAWLTERPSFVSRARGWLSGEGRRLYKAFNARRSDHKNSRAFSERRFPPLDVAEVNERLARLGAAVGRFDGLAVRHVRDDIFVVERDDARSG